MQKSISLLLFKNKGILYSSHLICEFSSNEHFLQLSGHSKQRLFLLRRYPVLQVSQIVKEFSLWHLAQFEIAYLHSLQYELLYL